MAERPAGAVRTLPPRTKRSWQNRTHHWVRWIHVYTSMISLLIVLFFGLTGITLNHPTWTFGDAVDHRSFQGTLPAGSTSAQSTDFLAVSEFVRSTYDVKGAISDYGAEAGTGAITFKGPGYAAELTFRTDTGAFDLSIDQQGFAAVMNDLHKGRDTSGSWHWVIDVAGGLLVLVAVTGLGIQLFLRKRRNRALLFATAGAVLTMVGIYLTMA